MELSNLSPSKGSVTTKKKRLGRGQALEKVVQQLEDIKVLNRDLVIQKNLV